MELDKITIEDGRVIKEAIIKLDQNGKRFLMVTEGVYLRGVITDGDIRRWILRNGDLSQPVSAIMNRNPKVLHTMDHKAAMRIMIDHSIESIPVVSPAGEVIGLLTWKDVSKTEKPPEKISAKVVIMAGGAGARLYPYTKILPKPLIPIGETPIVERIISEFRRYDITEFFLTVNYKKSMIKTYFNDVEKDYQLSFVEEDNYYGTAGSLKYLSGELDAPFFLSNCDVLVFADYSDILKFHLEKENLITVVASMKNIKIPYGVIRIGADENISFIEEKPEYDLLVNTGMYVLDPAVIALIPEAQTYHMTDLIEVCIREGHRVGTYPISESSWLDMGQIKEMEEMIRRLNV